MNETWLAISQSLNLSFSLAQTAPPLVTDNTANNGFSLERIFSSLSLNLGESLLNFILGILALIIGFLIASAAASLTRGALKRTNIDNRIASNLTGQASDTVSIEQWIANVVFWLIMLFAIVAFLQTIQLTAVSQPLNTLLQRVIGFVPNLISAAVLVGIAWALATLTKLALTRSLRAFRIDERLSQQVSDDPQAARPDERPFLLSETLANALYWFIFLLFLPSILRTLELQGTLEPVQQLLNNILSILPNILAAILIGAAGWLIAQVVRRIVTNLLAATGTDQVGRRFGLGRTVGSQSLSWLIGTVVYVLILIPTAIAALNALKIDAISTPAIAMLTQILNAIPQIFTAALIIVIAYVIGHFVSELIASILTSIGFNNIFNVLGLKTPRATTTPIRGILPPPGTIPDIDATPASPALGQETVLQSTPPTAPRTPSEWVGIIAWVGIILFAIVAATNVLQIAALTALVSGIVVISGRILAGLVVFAIGLYLANLAFSLITSSSSRQAQILGQTARIAIIALVSAMALQLMGIASDIVNLAFGLLLGAVAVAIALAFGLGARDIAAEQVRDWLSTFQDKKPPRL